MDSQRIVLRGRGRGIRGRGIRGRGRGLGRGSVELAQVGQRQFHHRPDDIQTNRDITSTQQTVKQLSIEPSQYFPRPSNSCELYSATTTITHKLSLSSTSSLATFKPKPPLRPGFGSNGRQIMLEANHFQISLPKGEIYHYDVEISPGNFSSTINRKVIKVIEEKYRKQLDDCKLAFDGKKNLYTSRKLSSVNGKDKLVLEVSIDNEVHTDEVKGVCFQVSIKFAALVSLDAVYKMARTASVMQVLDVVLGSMSSIRFAKVGRNFFTSPTEHVLSGGREVWFGYYQSARPTMWSVMLNFDVSATAFHKEQPVLDFIADVLCNASSQESKKDGGSRGGYNSSGEDGRSSTPPTNLSDTQIKLLTKFIKGLKVQVTHLPYPRKYKVKNVTSKIPSEIFFDYNDKEISVEEYFKNEYDRPLQYPELPCLHMDGKNPHIYIPIEFCLIIKQHCTKKLTNDQTKTMARPLPARADQRKCEIMKKIEEAEFDSDKYLTDFGISVSKEMTKVDGRVLDPPKLLYKNSRQVTPFAGSWNMDRNFFYKGCEVTEWGILYTSKSFDNKMGCFISQLSKASKEKGMSLKAKPRRVHFKNHSEDLKYVIESKFARFVQLIIVILDGSRGISYNEVKRVGDNLLGVCTQCIDLKNASKCNTSTINNLCLKINAKLGGTNSIPVTPEFESKIFERPVIIFGADVTHPAPKDNKSPSLAAVTASMDEHAVEYRAQVKVLQNRQEVFKVDELADIVRKMLLKFYYKYSKRCKPERIIFYRDGVSEGQFREVILNEVAAVQKACKTLEDGYEPGITFVVVQKRHHTRFFCVNKSDECGNARNVPPGTTVDKGITHPNEFDFYLCSHNGIQGTSRPCHYHVLWDDNKFSADDLQTLTYQLCYCYARCNRSVSYPAPTYYSHLAAFRARMTLQDWEGKVSDSVSYLTDESISGMEKAIKVNECLEDTMYFI